MLINSESIIGKIVAENYKTAAVFKSYNIDFCCNGNRSIAAASKEKNIDEKVILQELSEVLNKKEDSDIDFKSPVASIFTPLGMPAFSISLKNCVDTSPAVAPSTCERIVTALLRLYLSSLLGPVLSVTLAN